MIRRCGFARGTAMKMADSARDVEDAVPYEINMVHNKRRLK